MLSHGLDPVGTAAFAGQDMLLAQHLAAGSQHALDIVEFRAAEILALARSGTDRAMVFDQKQRAVRDPESGAWFRTGTHRRTMEYRPDGR